MGRGTEPQGCWKEIKRDARKKGEGCSVRLLSLLVEMKDVVEEYERGLWCDTNEDKQKISMWVHRRVDTSENGSHRLLGCYASACQLRNGEVERRK